MKNYLIVGGGRCARHFDHYLSLLNIPHACWSRSSQEDLAALAKSADCILLLISDSAIADFFATHPFLPARKTVHFSGALSHPQIAGAHPLMTFGPELYDLETYMRIPFVCEKNAANEMARPFEEILLELPNPHHHIAREEKSYYHALCSMSGNFTTMLWEMAAQKFESELNLPRELLLPYLERTYLNLQGALSTPGSDAPKSVLTGPLQRGDNKTLIQHLDALQGRPEQSIYYSFMNYFFAQHTNRRSIVDEHTRF